MDVKEKECAKMCLQVSSSLLGPLAQCDQVVRLFFNIWPFAEMKNSPIMSQTCQSIIRILPNKK